MKRILFLMTLAISTLANADSSNSSIQAFLVSPSVRAGDIIVSDRNTDAQVTFTKILVDPSHFEYRYYFTDQNGKTSNSSNLSISASMRLDDFISDPSPDFNKCPLNLQIQPDGQIVEGSIPKDACHTADPLPDFAKVLGSPDWSKVK